MKLILREHRSDARRRSAGQILPLTALFFTVLLGFTALAIDVSFAYLEERNQRAAADAAALAGAQDLQIPGSADFPGAPQVGRAQQHAMDVLANVLGASGSPAASGSCVTSAGCALPGTPYVVSIQWPSPTCIDCHPRRALQVSVRQPEFGVTFARLFGQDTWNVTSTSVAGVLRTRQYGVVTLRPPRPRGKGPTSDANEKNIQIGGGSKVIVGGADVWTNTNMFYGGLESELVLEPGYDIYHHDPYKLWTGSPEGVWASSLLPDPAYPIPTAPAGTPVYNTPEQAMGTDPLHPGYDPDYETRCLAQQALVPSSYVELKTGYQLNDPVNVKAHCYRAGIYNFMIDSKTDQEVILLEPGVFYLDHGVNVQSSLIGGYVPAQPGVALVLLEAKNQAGSPGQMTTATNTSLLALNFGNAYPDGTGTQATAANGPDGPVAVETGTGSTLMSIMVRPDPGCIVENPQPPGCKENENQTLKLTGGGNIFLAGIQYAPTDNASFSGNSNQDAEIGQLIAWTLKFDSSRFNIRASVNDLNGILRLDRACSPTEICNP